MHRATRPTIGIVVVLLSIAFSHAAADTFPRYDLIEPNVEFWTDIYTRYTSRQAVVHDSHDLAIVYEVIDLKKPYGTPGARKVNRKQMKRAKAKYLAILKKLAANPLSKGKDCQRVAKLFGPDAGKRAFQQASQRIRSQIGQRDRFRAGLVRSGAYIDEIRTIFDSYGLPAELAYLPHVESSFNLKAYSKFGAAGIWQFTRSTGRRFMKVGYVLDERRDPIKATYAAARLLKENYEKLAAWPLAITAYNHGAAGMQRAKRAHGQYPAIFKNYKGRSFKFASRNFYSEFLAAVQIAENYEAYFGELTLDKPNSDHTVVLDGYVKFSDLCRHFKVSPKLVATMNPALRPPVIKGQKYVPRNYALRLPADVAARNTDLAAVPVNLYHAKQKPSRFYTVQRGDTAGKVARIHGVKLSSLILANNLNRRATIYPKQTLRIPLPGQRLTAKTKREKIPAKPILVAAKEKSVEKAVKPPAPEQSYPQPVLASILPNAATPKPEVLSTDTKAETGELPSAEIVSADVRFGKFTERNGRPVGILQVEVEETLGHYAEWAGVRTQRIRRLNGMTFGKTLHLHQEVKIPIHKVTAQVFEQQRYEYHKRLQEDFFAVYQTSKMVPYRVEKGDNYWSLCIDKFEVPMWLLQNSNPEVDFAALQINQKIWIPVIEKLSEASVEDAPSNDEDLNLSRLRLKPIRLALRPHAW